ncbi:MAG: hypothetical protein SWE60_03630 [Thermodesulfobacteriota bacterium]|nr:hypothetical protein [Thermodesulfobacteriota bacterium]
MTKNALILACLFMLTGTAYCFTFPEEQEKNDEVVDEVSVVVREDRVLVFSAVADQWIEKELRIKEKVSRYATGGRVVVVFTDHRVLGFSALINSWADKDLRRDESLESLEASGNVGTVVTNIRALSFNARTGRWVETPFRLH